jgi:hypothetical protein
MEPGFIFLFIFFAAIICLGNFLCTFGDVPWYMKSKERLTYEQTQFIRQIVNQSHQERGRSRGRGSNGRSRSGQNLIRIASTEEIQRQAESEKGYVPDYVEGAR